MHPDAGAIIGISLAGSVLLVAVLVLCMLNLPCCNHQLKIPRVGGTPRNPRPSTSSRSAILNFPFSRNSRNIRPLSAVDLHTQNQQHSRYNGSNTGLVNPLWQMQCHSCGVFVAASQHSLNHHHQCANQVVPCHCCQHLDEPSTRNNTSMGHSPNPTNTSSFQYNAPQLVPPAESPPPYPGTPNIETRSHVTELTNDTSSQLSNPPPYNPKYY